MRSFPALIAPIRQEIWGLPAVINFCAGGAGSILYGLSFVLPPGGSSSLGLSPVHLIRLFSTLLVAAGFGAVGVESRKPMNNRFLLHHLRRSWMSREVLVGLVFLILSIMDILSPRGILAYSALFMALLLLVCQVMMVYDAKGVEIWNTSLVAAHALSSNLYLACGLGLLFYSIGAPIDAAAAIMAILPALAVNLVLWWALLRSRSPDARRFSLRPLITPLRLTVGIGVGHLIPALILVSAPGIAMLAGRNALLERLLVLAGGLIVVGVTTQKAGIILGANSLKAITPGPVRPGDSIRSPG